MRGASWSVAVAIAVGVVWVPASPVGADDRAKTGKLRTECQAGRAESCAKLTEIVKTATDDSMRASAVRGLTDQALLAQIAKTDGSRRVRAAAVEGLADQALLADVARTDEGQEVRVAAVEKLADQALVAQIAETDKAAAVRVAAVKRLTDQGLVARIAKTDDSVMVVSIAIRRLTDQGLLADVAKNIEDGESGFLAVEAISDQALLADVARSSRSGDVAQQAAERLTDPGLLMKLAGSAGGRVQALAGLRVLLLAGCVTDKYGAVEVHSWSRWVSKEYVTAATGNKTIRAELVTLVVSSSRPGGDLVRLTFGEEPGVVEMVDAAPAVTERRPSITLQDAWSGLRPKLDPGVVECLLARKDLPFTLAR